MSRVKIEVTQQDIDMGERRDCCECPIALAARRVIPCTAIWALRSYLRVFKGTRADDCVQNITWPTEAKSFISDFDAGKPVAPFTFEVEL